MFGQGAGEKAREGGHFFYVVISCHLTDPVPLGRSDTWYHVASDMQTSMFALCSPPGKCVRAGRAAAKHYHDGPAERVLAMAVSISVIASPAQRVSCFKDDGYYACDGAANGERAPGPARALRRSVIAVRWTAMHSGCLSKAGCRTARIWAIAAATATSSTSRAAR